MGINKFVAAAVIAVFVISGVLFLVSTSTHAEGAVDSQEISRKLEEVLNNQKTILADLAALRNEIQIVKIRVTQQQ